ncbi:hypothetical protein [Streptosporangium amethystogenes]|uniref:hypothetical protein n=1 Tax=Streptosporangium amethystogenes TaxID=2002 RepID=UPI0004CB2E18|nr:hypothetical protein [Streptosporangium amethystogenes]
MLAQRRRLPSDVLRQGPDDLAQGGADEVADVGGRRLAVEHHHDQAKRLGLGEGDRGSFVPRPSRYPP